MIFRDVKGFKIIVIKLDFRALYNLKPHTLENRDNLLHHLSYRMLSTNTNASTRKRDVNTLFKKNTCFFLFFYFLYFFLYFVTIKLVSKFGFGRVTPGVCEKKQGG